MKQFSDNLPADLTFNNFIDLLIQLTESTKPYSENYQIIENANSKHQKNLNKAFRHLSRMAEKKEIPSRGTEWFLDNYYIVQETVDIIQDDLPKNYFNKLPSLNDHTEMPRIYFLARQIIAYYQIDLVYTTLHDFLNAYQENINLSMSELWALPLMLRLTLIELLAGTIFELISISDPLSSTDHIELGHIEPDEIIARTIQTLLLLDRIDWKELFETHSQVEKLLQQDPANVYSLMDFETRDQYRKKIENLADKSGVDELEVAQQAVSLAANAELSNKKTSHVGYYLIGDGESRIKSEIGFRQSYLSSLKDYLIRHNVSFYLGTIFIITLSLVIGLMLVSRPFVDKSWHLILIGFLSLIPCSSVAVNLINSILTAVLPPQTLPKLDFSERIPSKYRTMVTIPALLTNKYEINFLLKQLELHFLANNDRNIGFALLSDYKDSPEKNSIDDEELLEMVVEGINDLNQRYQGIEGQRPFYLLNRRRQWNPKENAWMGWERKRGKLADFNRHIQEGYEKCFDKIIGEAGFLSKVRFVITVDSDTVLPRASANDLIATLAHPLNRAEFKDGSSKVTGGYTILQPRTEVKPTSVNKTFFTRVFAGDLGLDLYTRAVSDVYQDLFGEGSYVGKGIYDVEAFQRSLKDMVPENALLSHDLFEGLQARSGLVSDIVFFEDYPPNYAAQVNRLHRWVRGDWQLLPWLFPRVPTNDGQTKRNPFSAIDLWKIFDNLRRSLLSPLTFISLVFGWIIFREKAWVWTIFILTVSAFPILNHIVSSLSSKFLMGAKANIFTNIRLALYRWILWLVFLPYESLIMADAIIATLVRILISKKRLLQWQTSAHTIRLFGRQHQISTIWQQMIRAPLISIFSLVMVYFLNPDAIWVTLPFVFFWLISPQIAYWISLERKSEPMKTLSKADLQKLRSIARRTWLYFERFIGPEDHWLPPDHFQEDPKGVVAHRTSPTNIGLLLLSSASAYEFGYIGVLDFIYRMNYTFETLDGLEKYRGHLLNWYDTRSLETLSPRYVSTVDSGNYAVSLIGLKQSLLAIHKHSILPNSIFRGLNDTLEVLCNTVSKIDSKLLTSETKNLEQLCREIQKNILNNDPNDSYKLKMLKDFQERLSKPLNDMIRTILDSENLIDTGLLQDIRYWSESIFQYLQNIQQQIDLLAPWINTWQNRPDFFDKITNKKLHDIFHSWAAGEVLNMDFSAVSELCNETIATLRDFLNKEENLDWLLPKHNDSHLLKTWLDDFIDDLEASNNSVAQVFKQIESLTEKIDFYLERMEFRFLYDDQREVFYLGYQVGSGRLDKNHYDLLASEARTASLYAIAQNEVPRSHWLHMSRPFTTVSGTPTLISWNGSMFEYLMPNLFTKTYPETLLQQTAKGVVKAQIDYGKQNHVPWGISESSYYRFDQADNYQYQGFGVPKLGRKRGLANDLVIAPYASLIAVGVDPHAVIKNIDALQEAGALGHFGFYESIDYTTSRLAVGQDKAVIKSYMAHHQGMILVALSNFLNDMGLVEKIHKDPRIQSTELLLQEQIPEIETVKTNKKVSIFTRGKVTKGISYSPWNVEFKPLNREVHVISNGNMRLMMSDTGSGYLDWRDIALTRWRQDATLDPWGLWHYIQDIEEEDFWSIGRSPVHNNPQEYRVIFSPHMIEIRHLYNDIRAIIQTTIPPNDDICIQKITLTNQSNKERQLRLLSYGEPVLAPQATDRQHPAFNKMFIESEFDQELKMLQFLRRKRSANDDALMLAHMIYDDLPGQVEYESDRDKFIGRGNNSANPQSVLSSEELSGTTGFTLDPIFSLGKRITILPNQTVKLTYLTIAAENKMTLLNIADKYQSKARINNAFSSAENNSEKLLRALNLESANLPIYQTLLSRIIYPNHELRPALSVLNANELSQSGLWPLGISGDYPILLVRINHQEKIGQLQEILMSHSYWKKMGMMIDLVILNTKDTGYAHELNEKILKVINIGNSQNWVNQRGGIFVLTSSQLDRKTQALLQTVSRVMIDCESKSIEKQLKQADVTDPHLPVFNSSNPDHNYVNKGNVPPPENLIFNNGFGGFTPDGKEYQIYLQNYPNPTHHQGNITPKPWVNIVANENFGFSVSESGSGYTWANNSGENRLTPWTNDPVSDPSGESLYIRDEITGRVWSPTPLPAGQNVDYLVSHGQGFSIFKSFNQGFSQQMKVYADAQSPVKIIELTLENETDEHRRLTTTYFAEWVLGPNREVTKPFIVSDFDNESGSLFARNTYGAEFAECVAFLTSNKPVHGLTSDRKEFLGSPGDRQFPEGLKRVGLSGKVTSGVDPCAALQTHLNFSPAQKHTVIFCLGQGKSLEETKALANKFSRDDVIINSWDEVCSTWDDRLLSLQVETPDNAMDLMLNRWLPYQVLSSRIWGRTGFYQSSGAYGFRDQLQDVTSIITINPEICRKQIIRAAGHQFEEGDVLHWWHPPSGRGVRTRITDDLLWLNYVTAEYVKKTGDSTILDEEVSFLKGEMLADGEEERYGLYETSKESGTLFEHCQRALEFADTQGPHGLPLIGSGDWNDGMNRVGIHGKGESVWLAWFLYENHIRFAALCELKDDHPLANKHQERAEKLCKIINEVAWDGEWFLRAFYDDGTPLGSKENEECQIDSLPQSWSVLTDAAPKDKQAQAINSMEKYLIQHEDRLIKLFTPPFDKTLKDPGYIKGYPPGVRENGGQYTHAATWAVWALAKLEQGNKAFKYFNYLNPITHSLNFEEASQYQVEPYVVAADIYSTGSLAGSGGWTWYTGSSGWLYRLGVEAILGFQMDGNSIKINPCIPAAWNGYKVTYRKDGCTYHIKVDNTDHVETGVKSVTLDGELLSENSVPMLNDQSTHTIIVTMGQ